MAACRIAIAMRNANLYQIYSPQSHRVNTLRYNPSPPEYFQDMAPGFRRVPVGKQDTSCNGRRNALHLTASPFYEGGVQPICPVLARFLCRSDLCGVWRFVNFRVKPLLTELDASALPRGHLGGQGDDGIGQANLRVTPGPIVRIGIADAPSPVL